MYDFTVGKFQISVKLAIPEAYFVYHEYPNSIFCCDLVKKLDNGRNKMQEFPFRGEQFFQSRPRPRGGFFYVGRMI